MTYGLEMLTLNGASIQCLEQAHGSVAKSIQGLPKQTINAACIAPLGWISMEAFLDLTKMLFLWKVLCLPISNLYKKIAITRVASMLYRSDFKHLGPVACMVMCFNKYDLSGMLSDAIVSGVYMNIAQAKTIIKRAVVERDKARFISTCFLYKSLSVYTQCIKSVQLWNWWHYTKIRPDSVAKCKIIARLLLSETCFSDNTYRFSNSNGSVVCDLCSNYYVESGPHVLFECEHGSEMRHELMTVIKREAPEQLWHEILKGDKMTLFLNCFGSLPVFEWIGFYDAVVDFMYKMYKYRSTAKKSVSTDNVHLN